MADLVVELRNGWVCGLLLLEEKLSRLVARVGGVCSCCWQRRLALLLSAAAAALGGGDGAPAGMGQWLCRGEEN